MNDEDLNFVKKKKKEIEISRTYIRWKDIIIREKKWETNIYIYRKKSRRRRRRSEKIDIEKMNDEN